MEQKANKRYRHSYRQLTLPANSQFAAFSFRLNRLGGMLLSISLGMNL